MVYNVQLYSGMMFQFVCELKKKRRRGGLDVLAAGGRYDETVNNFRSVIFILPMTLGQSHSTCNFRVLLYFCRLGLNKLIL